MLLREQAQRLFELSLAEFAPEWHITGGCEELTLTEPDHWLSGFGTYGFTVRHRITRDVKVLGRHRGGGPGATHHRGISYRVLEAYAERMTDPIRRYFEEVGILVAGDRGSRFVAGRGGDGRRPLPRL